MAFPVCAWSALWVPHPHRLDLAEVPMLLCGLCHPPVFLALLPRALTTLQPQGCVGVGLRFGFVLRKPQMH